MQRAEKIGVILSKRKDKALVVDKTLSRLDEVEEQVKKSFDTFRQVFSLANDAEMKEKINGLNAFFNEVFVCLSDQKTNLRKVKLRFTRDTINIGITGQAQQGKSTFLQQLTGLSEGEIPTGDKGHCTGAPSFIVHKDVENTYAELSFFSEESFLNEVLKPYFFVLSDELDRFQPMDLDDFKSVALPEIREATKAGYIEKLKKLQANLHQYRGLLTGVTGKRIEQNQIREYVAQENEGGTQKYFKWVAVQQAKIFCKFPQEDLGQIQIGDTPGLGDFICGAEDRLVENIGSHLDVVVLLRKPESKGAILKKEDSGLYDLIKKANPSIELKDWSYLVLNLSEDNQSGAEFFQQQWLEHGNGHGSMQVRDILHINCKQASSVHDGFDHMISDMVNNLERVDEILYEKLLSDFSSLRACMTQLVVVAKSIIPKSKGDEGIQPLDGSFDKLYDKLTHGLRKQLLAIYREHRQDDCIPLKEALEMIYADLAKGPCLPDMETIEIQISAKDDGEWFFNTLSYMRNYFWFRIS